MKNYFSDKELMCKCGCNELIFDDELLNKMNQMREILNRPLVVNSAYRCKEHNEKIGGVANSSHILGKAVDLSAKTGKEKYEIIKVALDVGLNRIGVANTFIHLDNDETKIEKTIWLY